MVRPNPVQVNNFSLYTQRVQSSGPPEAADAARVVVNGGVMEDLLVRRWTRYGHDRLYVSTAAGHRLGWYDVKTGETTVESAEHAVELAAAIAAWSPQVPPPEQARPEPELSAVALRTEPMHAMPAAAPWRDLALNRPGEMARSQAEVELAAMRDRTRVGTFIARAFDMKTDERAWRVGAGGEETVGAKLEKLREHGWRVLHSVPVGSRGSDIDHVLMGWGGVYTINTKTHPGKKIWVSPRQIRVGGQPVDYLRNARFESERASKLLTAAIGFPVFVKPVLVFLTGTLIPDVTIKQRPDDVLILDRMDVPRAFRKAPVRLSPEQVNVIFESARRSTTWV